jgi:hypothetical protein
VISCRSLHRDLQYFVAAEGSFGACFQSSLGGSNQCGKFRRDDDAAMWGMISVRRSIRGCFNQYIQGLLVQQERELRPS